MIYRFILEHRRRVRLLDRRNRNREAARRHVERRRRGERRMGFKVRLFVSCTDDIAALLEAAC